MSVGVRYQVTNPYSRHSGEANPTDYAEARHWEPAPHHGWPLPPNRSAQSFSNSSLGVPGRGYHGRIKIEIVFMMVAGRNGGGVSD